MKAKKLLIFLSGAMLTASLSAVTALCDAQTLQMPTADASAAHIMTAQTEAVPTASIPEPWVEVQTVTEYITEYQGINEGCTVCGVITAYCPCSECCGKSDGINALGRKAKKGDIACNWLPLNSIVKINGKEYTVADHGSPARFNTIGRCDMFFPTHEEACSWGKQNAIIEVISIGG